jgi:hypothetical protein
MTLESDGFRIDASELFGVMAEFETPRAVLYAARQASAAGYRSIEAYTPLPVRGLPRALGQVPTKLPWLTFLGGVLGGASGYALQYWSSVIEYPLNIGGRPLHSWPGYLPVTFELTVLGAALFSVLGMLALNGLPMPYHPVFNVEGFRRASRDRFFLCIMSNDRQFDRDEVARFLKRLQPTSVVEVPR